MSLQTSKLILEKIATLHHSMSLDETQIAPIERDLMLNYVRQLYEHFLELPVKHRTHPIHAEPIPAPTVVKPVVEVPKPIVETPKPIVETPKPVVEVPKPIVEAPKPVVEAPKPVVEVPKPVVEVPKPIVEVPKPIVEIPKPVVENHKPVVEVAVEVPKTRHLSAEIMALFEISHGTELLDRLAQSPIADLNRAFSLNDRLLNIKELFAGNNRYFDETVKAINTLKNYEAAQEKLEDLAILFNWAGTDDRKKAARNFLKIVRRRFK
jgi:hypothetical protein